MNTVEAMTLLNRRDRYKTAHILHLILSLLTGGLWIIVWIIVAISNANERQKVDIKLKKMGAM